jgi:peptidyl-prolyl cis-trans isomerase C
MKSFLFLACIFTTSVCAQSTAAPAASSAALAPAPMSKDKVVATFGHDRKITVGQLEAFMSMLPEQMQKNALHDRKGFVQQFALMHQLSELAEQAKLGERSPTKENLMYYRMYILMNAELHEMVNDITISDAEAQSYYDKNKDHFSQVKVRAIYVSFAAKAAAEPGKGKPVLTEAEAKAKIEKLRADLVAGGDFVKMVKEYSEDSTSAAKDGDFGTIRHTDNLPDAIRQAIFALKAGELSEPVKQPNGFYLFRADEVTPQPFAEVKTELVNELKQVRFKAWMDETVGNLNLKYEDEATVGQAAPPAKSH